MNRSESFRNILNELHPDLDERQISLAEIAFFNMSDLWKIDLKADVTLATTKKLESLGYSGQEVDEACKYALDCWVEIYTK